MYEILFSFSSSHMSCSRKEIEEDFLFFFLLLKMLGRACGLASDLLVKFLTRELLINKTF